MNGKIHHLVLDAFIRPRLPGEEALHGNDDRTDNRLENLRWGTRSENLFDAVRNGKRRVGNDHYNARLNAFKVRCIRALARQGVGYALIAKTFNVKLALIADIFRAGRKRTWKGVPEEGTVCQG